MRISMWLLLLGLAACNGSSADDVAELEKRVTQLEKKVKGLEAVARGKKPAAEKGKGGAEKKPAGGGERAGGAGGGAAGGAGGDPATLGNVKAEGDAAKVVLSQGKKRFKVPGKAPAGKYTIMAAFGEEPLGRAGELTVEAKETVTVNCTSSEKTCTPGAAGG